MAEIKVSELSPITEVPDNALIYVVVNGVSHRVTKENLLAGLQNAIETDKSLYFDLPTKQLRGNVGQATNVFKWTTGVKTFVLVNEPSNIGFITVNGLVLDNPLTDWLVIVESKTVFILKEIPNPSVININYQFIITK